VKVSAPAARTLTADQGRVDFTLANTGAFTGDASGIAAYSASDVFRLSVSVDGPGCSAGLQNALAAVKAGESKTVPVYVLCAPGTAKPSKVILSARSESDPTKESSAAVAVSRRR
jgi:hypothetical protein